LTRIAALLLLLTSAGPAAAQALENCEPFADFASAVFKPPTEIDNKWFPFAPGKQFTFMGRANLGDEEARILPRIVVFTVTDMTKVVSGVETLVILEQDFATNEEGQQFLVEEELAFFAQDEDGNVWSLGEYSEEFEDGEFIGAPSTWINGVDDAQGGILVLGRQRRGTEYLQVLVPSIEVFDCGLVHRQVRIRVRGRVFQNVVVVRERDAFDPEGGIQQKYYAHGLGLVKVDALGDPEGETLDLVKRITLGSKGMATTRENVERLESNAYNSEDDRVRDVYGRTDPAQQLPADVARGMSGPAPPITVSN
jgi:hypothetical protein